MRKSLILSLFWGFLASSVPINELNNQLYIGARIGDLKVVQLAIEAGASIDARDKDQATPLHIAAQKGHLAVVRFLVEAGASINARCQRQRTPFQLAAGCDHESVVQYLETHLLLLEASGDGDFEQVTQSISDGAFVNVRCDDGATPLHWAARLGHADIVALLLRSNADFNALSINQETPLHLAARYGHQAVVGLLLDLKADVDVRNADRETPLHLAARNGHDDIVCSLLDAKADLDALNFAEETPLRVAWNHGHFEAVRLLFNTGASFFTPLSQDVVDLALERGLDGMVTILQARLDTNSEELLRAALLPDSEFIQKFLDKGVNINFILSEENSNWPTLEGKTALQVAAATTGDVDVIRMLLDAGADRTIRDSDGHAAFDLAIKNEHFDAADILQHDP